MKKVFIFKFKIDVSKRQVIRDIYLTVYFKTLLHCVV
jgi:hypothetical protein